jgi:hypothetical protein
MNKLMNKTQLKSFENRLKYVNDKTNLSEFVYDMILHPHNKVCSEIVIKETGSITLNQFSKYDFTKLLKKQKTTLNKNRVLAIIELQNDLNLYNKTIKQMNKGTTTKKVVAKRKATTAKVTKKAVAKKVTKKQSVKEKLFNQYKVVTQYSESLLQNVYSVVYRTKELKRFINENLCNKYIEQEVLLKMNEKAVKEPTKIKGITKELKEEFETI